MTARAAPLRLVLDTNIWLDWLVFGDTSLEPVKNAHATGAVEIRIDEVCERELAVVLGYDLGKHSLTADARTARLAECRRIAQRVDVRPAIRATALLPRCRDPDDQKFLKLALDCGADCLVTRDRELLVLARRKARRPPCRIVTPLELGAILSG